MNLQLRKTVARLCMVSLMFATSLAPAHAAMLAPTTATTMDAGAVVPETQREQLQAFFAREEVREQLVSMGVAPDEVDARIAALSETEVQELAASVETGPAGSGLLGVLGIIFVVLLVLEILGVTNVFTSVGPAHSN